MQSQQSNLIHCKISFGNEFRRGCLTQFTYEALESLLRSLFNPSPETPLIIKYQDEENDLITLSSDLELATALSTIKPSQLFRLTVSVVSSIPPPTSPPSTQNSPFTNCSAKGMKRHFKRMKIENSEEATQMKHARKAQKQEEKADFIRQFNAAFTPEFVIVPNAPLSLQTLSVKLTNIGSAPWPEGTQFVRLSKWKNLDEKIPISVLVAPGGAVTLSITVHISDKGFHMSKWRLVLPNGSKFGTKFWVKTQNFSGRWHHQGGNFREAKRKYGEGMMRLRQMGFGGPYAWRLMKQYDGDVDQVVAELISRSKPDEEKI